MSQDENVVPLTRKRPGVSRANTLLALLVVNVFLAITNGILGLLGFLNDGTDRLCLSDSKSVNVTVFWAD